MQLLNGESQQAAMTPSVVERPYSTRRGLNMQVDMRREKQSDATLLPAKTSRLRENFVSRELEVLGKVMCLGEPDGIVARDTIIKKNIEKVSVSEFREKSTTYII